MLKTASSYINSIGALVYQGTWDASTNTPTLVSSVGNKGDYYVVSVAGNTNLNGITDWKVNDIAAFNGSVWQKIDNTDNVTSVNGQTGVVVLTAPDVGATPNTAYVNVAGLLSGGGQLVGNVTVSLTNVPLANVTGAGTMASQNANAVTITGGTINGVTENAATYTNVTINSGNATLTNVTATNGNITNFSSGNVSITGGTTNNVTQTNVVISSGNATLNIANLTYANIATAIRTQTLTGYLYGNANTGNVSASTTIPNSGLANSTFTLGNTTVTLGGATTNLGNLTLANANITSVAATFPNSYLTNSAVTIGNTSVSLGSTITSVGNLSLDNVTVNSGNVIVTSVTAANVTVTSNFNANLTTNASATFATSSLPLVPEGYLTIVINGVSKKIPYYGV